MTDTRLKTLREHLLVTTPDGKFDVWTKPFDYDLWVRTAKQHDWPGRDENAVGYLLFISWSAARRAGEIDSSMKYEAYREWVEDLEQLVPEAVGPTGPAAGAG